MVSCVFSGNRFGSKRRRTVESACLKKVPRNSSRVTPSVPENEDTSDWIVSTIWLINMCFSTTLAMPFSHAKQKISITTACVGAISLRALTSPVPMKAFAPAGVLTSV